jgi:hypothetical protein
MLMKQTICLSKRYAMHHRRSLPYPDLYGYRASANRGNDTPQEVLARSNTRVCLVDWGNSDNSISTEIFRDTCVC